MWQVGEGWLFGYWQTLQTVRARSGSGRRSGRPHQFSEVGKYVRANKRLNDSMIKLSTPVLL